MKTDMHIFAILSLILCIWSCAATASPALPETNLPETTKPDALAEIRKMMVDSEATPETVELYRFLKEHTEAGSGLLYGHESDNMQGWSFQKFNPDQLESDVLASIGDLPAIFGYDFNRGYEKLLPIARQAAEAGGIITISNHMKYPTTNSYHISEVRHLTDDPIKEIMPGGIFHAQFLEELDRIAKFAEELTVDGKQVPILFRPWLEHTGGWFWWGSESCTEKQYNELWRFTVRYLRDQKKVHNLLYVISPSRPGERGGYENRNPGAEWIDIAGFDCYQTSDDAGAAEEFLLNAMETARYAKKHNKIAAFAEFGFKKGINKSTNPLWYTQQILEPLAREDLLSTFAYGMNWQDGDDTRWIPMPTDIQHADFARFHDHDEIHFLNELKKHPWA